ncbi:MAG: DUF1579 domain-containing protein [Lacipirellulaceae bacterium]
MKSRLYFLATCLVFCPSFLSSAKAQPPQFPTPAKQHHWLEQFTGHWESLSKTVATPEQPAVQFKGSMKSRMLGKFWVVNEVRGEGLGNGDFKALQTVGYDAKKKKYVGIWIDSMMGQLWHYEGTVDETGKKLTLVAEGPDMMDQNKLTKYRDSYEFKSADLILATSEIMGPDGKWQAFMTGEMRRVEPHSSLMAKEKK